MKQKKKKTRSQIPRYEGIIAPKLSHERNKQLQELSHNEYNALRKVARTHGKNFKKHVGFFVNV